MQAVPSMDVFGLLTSPSTTRSPEHPPRKIHRCCEAASKLTTRRRASCSAVSGSGPRSRAVSGDCTCGWRHFELGISVLPLFCVAEGHSLLEVEGLAEPSLFNNLICLRGQLEDAMLRRPWLNPYPLRNLMELNGTIDPTTFPRRNGARKIFRRNCSI